MARAALQTLLLRLQQWKGAARRKQGLCRVDALLASPGEDRGQALEAKVWGMTYKGETGVLGRLDTHCTGVCRGALDCRLCFFLAKVLTVFPGRSDA